MSPSIRRNLAVATLAATAFAAFDPNSKTNVAVYWGQGPNQAGLIETCKNPNIDIVNIGFINAFPDNSPGNFPGSNFGNACGSATYTVNGVSTLLQSGCTTIASDITACQQTYGKKVLLSLGGAAPLNYYMANDTSATNFADFLWGAFGPQTSAWTNAGKPRPFGTAVVDAGRSDGGIPRAIQVDNGTLTNGRRILVVRHHDIERARHRRIARGIGGGERHSCGTGIKRKRNTGLPIVAGGGAVEMEISAYLHGYADKNVPHKQQGIMKSFAKALEVIPRQLCDNAGFDATDILNRLRVEHRKGHTWAGVDFEHEGVRDNLEAFVWEPSLVKINAIQAAVEASCLILSVDETIRNQESQQPQAPQRGLPPGAAQRAMRGRGRGMPMRG